MIAKDTSASTHPFAWDGVSFDVPVSWELGEQSLRKGVSRVVLEDEARPRLEIEWITPRTDIDRETVRKRYDRQARKLIKVADHVDPIGSLATGWNAFLYQMPGNRSLVVAYVLPPKTGAPFCFLHLHFDANSQDSPQALVRSLASSFSCTPEGLAPWSVYDVRFVLDRRFRLVGTALHAGRKMLAFEWRLRRLFLWHVSLADLVLRDRTVEDWTAEFLNDTRLLPAFRFEAEEGGRIRCHRKRRYPVGQFEEIGRMCFRCAAGCRHLPERNQIVVWLYHHRKHDDMIRLYQEFLPDGENPISG